MLEIVQIIKKDLQNNMDLNDLKGLHERDIFKWHFGIGLYIRNKYIHKNPQNFKILSEHYHTNIVDDISEKIMREIETSLD